MSFRGALAISEAETNDYDFENPCAKCTAPCLSACPVDAFTGAGYDVIQCKDHITGSDSSNCKNLGCNARRACPVGANLREFEQSSFHICLLYTSPSPRDATLSRMPSSA